MGVAVSKRHTIGQARSAEAAERGAVIATRTKFRTAQ
jgi:hypothetical protein